MAYTFTLKARTAARTMSLVKTAVSQLVADRPEHAPDQTLILQASRHALERVGPDDEDTTCVLLEVAGTSGEGEAQIAVRAARRPLGELPSEPPPT